MSDDAPTASPAEMLRLIETEKAAAERSLRPDPRLTYVPWGVAWLVGLGLLYLGEGPDGQVLVPMPRWLPLSVLFALLIVAMVISTRASLRAGRQVRGVSSVQGWQYGLTWVAAFAAVTVIAVRYSSLLPPQEVSMLWSSLSVAIVGVMYMTGAAIWQAPEMFVLGAWITGANIAGFLAGPGWHSLVLCLAGGGGLLVGGVFAWLRDSRTA